MLLLVSSSAFSQNTYPKVTKDSLIVITPLQLKQTNLIFLEHSKFKLEVKELNKQVNDYEAIVKYCRDINSKKQIQIDSLLSGYNKSQLIIQDKNNLILKQDKKLSRRKTITICGITVGVIGIIVGILAK